MKIVMMLLVALLVISFQPIAVLDHDVKAVPGAHYGVWPTNSYLYARWISGFVSAFNIAHSRDNNGADPYGVREWFEKWYGDPPTDPGVFPPWELVNEQYSTASDVSR